MSCIRTTATKIHLVSLALLTLSACGGGGGGGSGGGGVSNPAPAPPPAPPPVSTATLDIANTGKFGGALLQTVALAKEITETLRPGVNFEIPTGSRSTNCPLGGSLRTQLSNDRLRLTETYNDCAATVGVETVTLDGIQRTVYSGPAGNQAFTADVTFESLRATSGDLIETVDGTARYSGGVFANDFSQDTMTLDVVISNSREGTLTLNGVALDYRFSVSFRNSLIGVNGSSGRIAHSDEGEISLGYDSADGVMLLSGDGDGTGAVFIDGVGATVTFRDSVAGPASGFLVIPVEDILETEFFNDRFLFGPTRRSTLVSDLRNVLVLQQDTLEFSLRRNFGDRDGDLLTIELVPIDVTISGRDRREEVIAADDPRVAVTLEQFEAGLFRVNSATDAEAAVYRFEAFANDPTGLRSLDPLEVSFAVYRDSDLDRDADRFDNDDDNDGVTDFSDEFPLDPSESSDNDRDGIGDNGDPDDDNDGTPDVDDAYPFDGACFRDTDGNGDRCFLNFLNPRSNIVVDRDGIAYIFDFGSFFSGRFTVRRYDIDTGHFLSPIELDPSLVGLTPETGSYSIAYVESHHALYVSYNSAPAITRIDLSATTPTEAVFLNPAGAVVTLGDRADFGDYAVRLGDAGGYTTFDADGTDIDTYLPAGTSGDPDFTLPAAANFCEDGFTVNTTDGTFFEYTNLNGFNCPVFGEPVVSPDGLLGTTFQRQIFDQSLNIVATIEPQERLRGDFSWRWSVDGLFAPSNIGVEVFDDDATPITVVRPSGTPPSILELTVIQRRNFIVIVFRNSENGIEIRRYVPPPP